MAQPSTSYEPRCPAQSALYQIVLEHFETFPSCGGRRMAERAAHLVDRVFLDVAVRQWVLSLPHRIRYLVAWDHELCRAVVAVYLCTVLGFLRRRARHDGAGALRFHRTPRLTREEVGAVVAAVQRRIKQLLERRGLAGGDKGGAAADRWAEEAPVLAGIAAAAVQRLVALGPRAGARVQRRAGSPRAVACSGGGVRGGGRA